MVLRDVHADMSGYYKCEVTSQELYETVEKKDYLLVVRKFDNYNWGLGDGLLHIEGGRVSGKMDNVTSFTVI